jgi:hypothetical protein
MTDFDGIRVRARPLMSGFARACDRFQSAQDSGDTEATIHALFEALNWAHAIDDEIALTWSPRGKVEGYSWRSDPAVGVGEHLASVMDGLRYVRNRVHHQCADALNTRHGTCVWRPIGELPTPSKGREDPRGRAAYAALLAGHPAEEALATMSEAFEFLGPLLDPPLPVRTPRVVEVVTE